ncbi:hypothetical protein LUZ60_011088 [Juncus effusus]|nr:hypothetical protein LUZ60_011088 [Juncus effusus]
MSAPGLDEVMAFLTDGGFSAAASALRDDVLSRSGGDGSVESGEISHSLPRIRLSTSNPAAAGSSSSSSSDDDDDDDAFVSMHSSSPGLLNPYGMWSPVRPKSDSSSSELEFGTARDYDKNSEFFNESSWWYDESALTSGARTKDKFITNSNTHSKDCASPMCDCCKTGGKKGNSSGAVYGRYKIMEDCTEILDEFGGGDENVARERDVVFEGDLLNGMKELEIVGDYLADSNPLSNFELELENEKLMDLGNNSDNEDLSKGVYGNNNIVIEPFPNNENDDDAFDIGLLGPIITNNNNKNNSKETKEDQEDQEMNLDLALIDFQKEYETFDLRIIHRKNKTGFEENKEFPIIINSIIAGRYYVTEYLGSAAFSKVVQAHDLHTDTDVCLKIIKNDKDFFDQSLDEIKLLKFVNKYDPLDQHHVLRLFDYFYYQEHLFIVTELLRANLYEFQKYNQESGGEVYFTIPRIQSIARQILEALVYLHSLKIIHCDLKPENVLIKSYGRCEVKVIDLGSSCFVTDNLCLYVQSRSYRAPEVILGLSYDLKIDIWSLGCILVELYTGEVLFPNDSVAMMLARIIGIIGPIDMDMLLRGQDTTKYFTDEFDLFHKNEETDQMEYLIPEKSSLEEHLQTADSKFVDFISYLLQINPKRRPTAREALKHQWLSFSYQ